MGLSTPSYMEIQVSVVLAVYNGEAYLGEAVESVLAQTFRAFELIVVDDGSTDGTAEVLERFRFAEPDRVRVIQLDENSGQGEAFNRGIAVARGKLVSFMDCDDFWFPEKLECVDSDFGDPDKVALHQHHLGLFEDGNLLKSNYCPALSIGDVFGASKHSNRLSNFVPTSGLTFSKRALDQVGAIPASFRICADGYLTRTAICFGRVSGTDRALGAYRIHESNHTFQNESFDNDKYVRGLLVPELNAFYARRHISHRVQLDDGSETFDLSDGRASIDALNLAQGDRVVVVRSAPPRRLKPILAILLERGLRVDLLVQEGIEREFAMEGVTLHQIPAGPMSAETISTELEQALIKIDPKCLLIVYNGTSPKPYQNMHLVLAGLSLECPIVGLSTLGTLHPLDRVAVKQQGEQPADREVSQRFSNPPPRHFDRNDNRLLEMKDLFSGRRAFLIGNGPSLKMEDLDCLKDEVTIASNKIFLAYDSTEWRPTVYSMCDEVVARNNEETVRELPHLKIFADSVRKYLWTDSDAVFLNPKQSRDPQDDVIGWDLIRGANAGHSVLNLSIKIAYWMGIRELYIIGADHHFIVPDTKTGERIMNNDVIVSTGERNHFHAGYRPAGETWTVPKFAEMEADFAESKRILESAGGRIWNASRFSKLEVFERADLDEVLAQDLAPKV